MSRDRLTQLWREHEQTPFPALDDLDLTADLAEYDGYLAALISQVVGGARELPAAIRLDEALEERVRNTGSPEAVEYVDRLHRAAKLAHDIHKAGT